MSTSVWFLLVGALLLCIGLTAGMIRRLPVTTAIVYLAVGIVVGPTVLNAFHFNPLEESRVLAIATEVAVLLSLFTAGMKMPVPVTAGRWRTPILLAFPGMVITAALMTAFGYYALGLPLGGAVLLAGILAPTDPVLATEVQARHPGDRDRLRFRVTCEAGMNDGSAFPVVLLGMGLLGLHELGAWGWRWLLLDVAWGTLAGIGLGVLAGRALAGGVWRLSRGGLGGSLLHDFLALGLAATVYGVSQLIGAWGFLAVFCAAVALRQTEMRLTGGAAEPQRLRTRERMLPGRDAQARVTDRSLAFNEHLERLSEVVLILLLGGMLFVDSWSWYAVGSALFLFLTARPLGVFLASRRSRMPQRLCVLTGWFGVRGIGSLYYLMYAIHHGLPQGLALELLHVTLVVVTLSILVHGTSVKPMLAHLRRAPAAVTEG